MAAPQTFDVEAYKRRLDQQLAALIPSFAAGQTKDNAATGARNGQGQASAPMRDAVPSAFGLAAVSAGKKYLAPLITGAAAAPVAGSYSVPLAQLLAGSPAPTLMTSPIVGMAAPTSLASAGAPVVAPTTAAVGSSAAPSLTFGSIAAPVAAVLGPLIAGKLIEKTFFKQKPTRPFVPEEGVNSAYMEKKLPGFKSLAPAAQVSLINEAHNKGVYVVPGAGKIEDGKLVSKELFPTYVQPKLDYATRKQLSEELFRQTGKKYLTGATADEIIAAADKTKGASLNKNIKTFKDFVVSAKQKISEGKTNG